MKKPYVFVGAVIGLWLLGMAAYVGAVRLIRAPQITIHGVTNGANYPRGTTLRPRIVVSSPLDSSPKYTATLNGRPYRGEPITEPDLYKLKVEARDRFGLRSMEIVSFYIDTQSEDEIFDIRPLSIRFAKTEKGNVKLTFWLFITSKTLDYEEYCISAQSGVINKTNYLSWYFLMARIWLVYPKRGGKPIGWVAECTYIYSQKAARLLREALRTDTGNNWFEVLLTYDKWSKPPVTSPSGVRGIFEGNLKLEYWSDPAPLRIDESFSRTFYQENRLVLYRGHPTEDGISDDPNEAMKIDARLLHPIIRGR